MSAAHHLIWRKRGTRKSGLETNAENEARSALLARLWCHLIPQTPPNRAENLTRLCSATIGQTGWRMVQFGAIRSRLATVKNREFTENNGHKVTPRAQKTIRERVLAKDAGGRSQTSQASIRPRSTPVSRVGSRPRVAYIVNFIKNET